MANDTSRIFINGVEIIPEECGKMSLFELLEKVEREEPLWHKIATRNPLDGLDGFYLIHNGTIFRW